MKMEPLQNGCLKIWMNESDMQHWGLQFDRMHAQDEATRRAMVKLIALAQERQLLHQTHGLTVEALPLAEGCLLLLSPAVSLMNRVPQPLMYAFDDADALLQFRHVLTHMEKPTFPPASLYVVDKQYRLIVYAGFTPLQAYRRLLSEFAQPLQGDTAHTEEYGRALAIGNALQLLTANGSDLPKQSDLPR